MAVTEEPAPLLRLAAAHAHLKRHKVALCVPGDVTGARILLALLSGSEHAAKEGEEGEDQPLAALQRLRAAIDRYVRAAAP